MYILLISILILLPMKFLFENSPQEVFEPPSSFRGSRCHPFRLETLKFWKDWCCDHDDPYKGNLPAMTMKENNFPPVLEGVVPVWFSRSSKTASFASSSFSAASSMLVSVSCKKEILTKKADACNHNHGHRFNPRGWAKSSHAQLHCNERKVHRKPWFVLYWKFSSSI